MPYVDSISPRRMPVSTRLSTLSDDATTALGRQIVAVALAYAAKGWQESTNNAVVKSIWACYGDSTKDNRTPYCVAGAWVIVEQAVILLRANGQSVQNLIPNYSLTYGSAIATRNQGKNISALAADVTPAIGAMFYRKSDGASSGHFGIIIGIERNGSTLTAIETVEANASLDDSNVDFVYIKKRYTTNSKYWIGLPANDWTILHTERTGNATKTVSGRTSCAPVDVVPVELPQTPPKQDTPVDVVTKSEGTTSAPREQRGETPSTPGSTPPAVTTPCRNKYIVKSCCDETASTALKLTLDPNLRHYSALRDPNIAVQYVRLDFRSTDPFRMVQDNGGNLFFIAVESVQGSWDVPKEIGLFGSNYLVIPFNRAKIGMTGGNHDSGAARFMGLVNGPATTYAGREMEPFTANMQETFCAFHGLPLRANNVGAGYAKPTTGDTRLREIIDILWSGNALSFGNVMRDLEQLATRKGGKLGYNTIFLFTGQPTTFTAGLANAVSLAAPFVLGALGAAGIAVPQSTQILIASVLPNVLRGRFSFTSAAQLVELGGAILPQSFQPYTSKAKNVLNRLGSVSNLSGLPITDYSKLIAGLDSDLGIGIVPQVDMFVNGVKSQKSAFELFFNNAVGDIRALATKTGSDVGKVAQLFSNARVASVLSTMLSIDQTFGQTDGSLATIFREITKTSAGQIDTRQTIARDPQIRDLLLSSSALAGIGAMPLAHGIIKGILNVSSVRSEMIQNASDHYAWAAIAMGQKVSDDSLDTVRLDALKYKAIELYNFGWKRFELPAIFEGEKRECWEREVKICTGIECCPPQVKGADGKCTSPVSTNPPKQDPPVVTNPPKQDPPVISTPPKQTPPVISVPPKQDPPVVTTPPVKLPNCIRFENGSYVYCPPSSCDMELVRLVPTGATSAAPSSGFVAAPAQPVAPAPVSRPVTTVAVSPQVTQPVSVAPSSVKPVTTVSVSPQVTQPVSPQTIAPFVSAPSSFPTTPAPGATSPAPTASFRLSDGPCYPARVAYQGQPMELWFALIGDKWVELVDCCPERPAADCCDESRRGYSKLEERLSKLAELVSRLEVGERTSQTNYDSLRQEVISLRSILERQTSTGGSYNDSELRNRVDELERLLRAMQQQRTVEQTRYDDTSIREKMGELEQQIISVIDRIATVRETGDGYDDSTLRAELARQAQELERLRDLRTDNPSNDGEIAVLRREVERLQSLVISSPPVPPGTPVSPTPPGDISKLERELVLIRQNQSVMEQGYRDNIAALRSELSARSGESDTSSLQAEIARLEQSLSQQQAAYSARSATATEQVRSATRQAVWTSPTLPPPVSVSGCPDCPAVVETYSRIINRYPQSAPAASAEPCCN